MKTLLSTLMALLLCGSLCAQGEEKYTIRGTLPDNSFDGQTVRISSNTDLMWEGQQIADCTTIKNGKFTIKGKLSDTEPVLASINIGDDKERVYRTMFILEPAEINIEVNGRNAIAVSGTPLNDEFYHTVTKAQQAFSAYVKTEQDKPKEERKPNPEVTNAYLNGVVNYMDKYVEKHPKTVAGLFMLIKPVRFSSTDMNRTLQEVKFMELTQRIAEPYRSRILKQAGIKKD